MKNVLNYNLDKLVEIIKNNKDEFLNKIIADKNISEIDEIVFEAESVTIKWKTSTKYGSLEKIIIIKAISTNQIELTFTRNIRSLQIWATVAGVAIGLFKSWPFTDYIVFILGIWLALPLIILMQNKYLSKKHNKRLLDYLIYHKDQLN